MAGFPALVVAFSSIFSFVVVFDRFLDDLQSRWEPLGCPRAPEASIFRGPEPRSSSRFSIVLPFEFAFDFSMYFRCSLQLMPCRSWIGETSPNPDFVRPVEVFQGFFDIAHPCRHDESVVERSTIIQKSFEKINRIFIEKSNRNRRNIGSAPKLREKRIRTRYGTSWERPRASQQPLRSVLGGPWGRARTSRERPGALPKHPRSVPGAPPIAPNRLQGAPERFVVDFSSIWG